MMIALRTRYEGTRRSPDDSFSLKSCHSLEIKRMTALHPLATFLPEQRQ
ncbi:hypothetical protein AB395_00006401 (plasmid) [Sinorhizobium fredii CCBAU 45436]|nr:hypothetical protein AB395_00006401 [Sinorhizobium fredii CCBAU 45436]